MTLNSFHSMTIDPALTQCRCGLPKNEHPESRYYADADDDPNAELVKAAKTICAVTDNAFSRVAPVACPHGNIPSYPTHARWCDECWENLGLAIYRAEQALDNARVRLCRDGEALMQQALKMAFEEER